MSARDYQLRAHGSSLMQRKAQRGIASSDGISEASSPMVCDVAIDCRTLTDIRTETRHFIYFYLGHNAILLFKTQ